jgi:uncharacterized protein DUF2442
VVILIEHAEYKEDFKINLKFSDNIEQEIDFEPFLKKSLNPMTQKYLDKEKFKDFRIEYGDLVWNDYEMCFPIWDLHSGKIE